MSKYQKMPTLKEFIEENGYVKNMIVYLKNEETGRYKKLKLGWIDPVWGGEERYKLYNNAPPYRKGFYGRRFKSLEELYELEIRTEGEQK